MNRYLEAYDRTTGHSFQVDSGRPKAAIADELGFAAGTGRPMYRDTVAGDTIKIGYVFGQHWVELYWVEQTRWEGKPCR